MLVVAVWIPVCMSVKYLIIWINIHEMPAVWIWGIEQWTPLFNRTYKKREKFPSIFLKYYKYSLVLPQYAWVSIVWKWMVDCSQEEQYGVETQLVLPKILALQKCPILTYVWCI